SDDAGEFAISTSLTRRPLTLVISHLNYRTQTLEVNDLSTPLRIALVPKAAVLTQINIEDDNNRAKNLKEFHAVLIGTDNWGQNASMLNDEVVFFDRDYERSSVTMRGQGAYDFLRNRKLRNAEWSDDKKKLTYDRELNLKATTNGALRISLPDVGYVIHLDLQEFTNDYQSRQTSFLGTSFYQAVENLKPKQLKRVVANRERAYWGSRMHFARSLVRDSLAENGFALYEIISEKKFSKEIETAPVDLSDSLSYNELGFYELRNLAGRQFAVLYFGDRKYRPLPPTRRKGVPPIQSRFFMVAPVARIFPDGSLGDPYLVFSGDIGQRAMAWSLPSDYAPPE
ncbi:MAG: hypothetical protein AAGA62_07355, partial [Bacteroidota bacterium]